MCNSWNWHHLLVGLGMGDYYFSHIHNVVNWSHCKKASTVIGRFLSRNYIYGLFIPGRICFNICNAMCILQSRSHLTDHGWFYVKNMWFEGPIFQVCKIKEIWLMKISTDQRSPIGMTVASLAKSIKLYVRKDVTFVQFDVWVIRWSRPTVLHDLSFARMCRQEETKYSFGSPYDHTDISWGYQIIDGNLRSTIEQSFQSSHYTDVLMGAMAF